MWEPDMIMDRKGQSLPVSTDTGVLGCTGDWNQIGGLDIKALPTGSFEPPPPGSFFLIIGRASCTLQGIIIHPTLVDNDYEGEIKVIASSPHRTITIPPKQRLAQALPLPLDTSFPAFKNKRGISNPGSSDIYWVQSLSQERPTLKLKLQGKSFTGLIDSGADATIISASQWPNSWPLQPSLTHLQGIGQTQETMESTQMLIWEDAEGNKGIVRPFIVPNLPINLWGRDILSQMGIIMCSPNSIVTEQMLRQGFLPKQGLGKNNHGIREPIQLQPQSDRTGLGFQNQNLFS
ncbi:endogenous retrovirus group K member 7 Pro protein-like [Sminthopsis crassicaudata]|uniref:endogenous retrovirus group K member 7 Pro protein-like n=1 Tax=Sminthopsis crassicaudata TaxID=9301 RepID=UPI003D68E6A8